MKHLLATLILVATLVGCNEPVTGPSGEITLKCKVTNAQGKDTVVNCSERTK